MTQNIVPCAKGKIHFGHHEGICLFFVDVDEKKFIKLLSIYCDVKTVKMLSADVLPHEVENTAIKNTYVISFVYLKTVSFQAINPYDCFHV